MPRPAADGAEPGVVCTGLLSLRTHPWLADHAVAGTTILPGTALLEMARHAGDLVGAGHVAELVVEAPLVVPATGAVQVQVTVEATAPDVRDGRREVVVHAREQGPDGAPWTRHAAGTLTAEPTASAARPGDAPRRTSSPGHQRGPSRSTCRASTTPSPPGASATDPPSEGCVPPGPAPAPAPGEPTEVFVEVALPEDARADAARSGLHPALLDAVLHASALSPDAPGDGLARLPFAWTGATLWATGAVAVRARLLHTGPETVSLALADSDGAPIAAVESLTFREMPAGALARTEAGGPMLLREEWVTLPADPTTDHGTAGWAVLGELDLPGAIAYPDVATLLAGASREPAPEVLVVGDHPGVRAGH